MDRNVLVLAERSGYLQASITYMKASTPILCLRFIGLMTSKGLFFVLGSMATAFIILASWLPIQLSIDATNTVAC